MERGHKELQLLHDTPSSSLSASFWPSDPSSMKLRSDHNSFDHHHHHAGGPPSLDLQLSISLQPISSHPPPPNRISRVPKGGGSTKSDDIGIEALKWQAGEQIRMAGMEKAYAERVREMSRREMELAQSEFSRARRMWVRAREEVDKAQKLKQQATTIIDSSKCMEITCQACRQTFRPN